MIRSNFSFSVDTVMLYMLAAALFYIVIFLKPQWAFPISIFFLSWSYFLIIVKRKFYPIVTLIIYARIFVGFSAINGPLSYTLLNILTNYLPIILYFFSSSMPMRPNLAIKSYPWTYLYGIVLLIFSLTSGFDAITVLGNRLLPFFLFLLFLMRGTDDDRLLEDFIPLMRYLVLASIIVRLFPGYLEQTLQYLEGGFVFGTAALTSVKLGDLIRGVGPFWDPRLLGIMSVLYFAIVLSSIKRIGLGLDFIISFTGVAISLSRGSIGISVLLILILFFTNTTRAKLSVAFLVMSLIVVFSPYFMDNYLERIYFSNGVNPFEQRFGFTQAAIAKFLENPMGSGVGSMRNISIGIDVAGAQYFVVSDAYWAILLAEIGIIGVVIFLLSFREIFWGNNPVSKGLFLGFIIQMIGTDIGDFSMYYLVILVVGKALCGVALARKKDILVSPHER